MAYKYSAMWKGIISSSEKFMQNIRYHVCLGKKIVFWKETWIGEEPLASKFPDLFNCAQDKQAKVESYMDRSGLSGQIMWSSKSRRNLKENEEIQFLSLIDLLRDIHFPEDMEDTRIWKASKNGSFSVSSFYAALSARVGTKSSLASIWRIKAPPWVVAFRWIAFRRRILTLDNLRKRGKIVVIGCQMCLEDEETVDHLLLRCSFAMKIWNSVINWFKCKWAMPKALQHLFEEWTSLIGSKKGKELWKLSFLAVILHIWKERNARCFEGKKCLEEILCDKIKFSVVQWVQISPTFKDYPIDQIMFSWKELAFS